MIVLVGHEGAGGSSIHRAEVLETIRRGDEVMVAVRLLDTGRRWEMSPTNIFGFEVSKDLVITVKR